MCAGFKVHTDFPPEVCDPVTKWWRMALVDGDTLVYFTARRLESDDDVHWELGAIGHGPAAGELSKYLCDEIETGHPCGISTRHRWAAVVGCPGLGPG